LKEVICHFVISGRGAHLSEELIYCPEPFGNGDQIGLSKRANSVQNGIIPFAIDEIEKVQPKIIFLQIENDSNGNDSRVLRYFYWCHLFKIIVTNFTIFKKIQDFKISFQKKM